MFLDVLAHIPLLNLPDLYKNIKNMKELKD